MRELTADELLRIAATLVYRHGGYRIKVTKLNIEVDIPLKDKFFEQSLEVSVYDFDKILEQSEELEIRIHDRPIDSIKPLKVKDNLLPSEKPVEENKKYFVDFNDMNDGFGGLAEYYPQHQFDDLEEAKKYCDKKMANLDTGNRSCGEYYAVINLETDKVVYRGR